MSTLRDKQLLRRLLAQQERAVQDAFLEAFARVVRAIDRRAVLEALQAGDMLAALDLLNIREELLAPLYEAIRASYISGGAAIAAAVPPVRAVLGFDGRHWRAEEWIRVHAANKVTAIAADQREAIRAVVLGQVQAGRGPRAILTDIVGYVTPQGRAGGIIGLTAEQTSYVYGKFRADGTFRRGAYQELQNLDPHYFTRTRRDRRFDPAVRRAIAQGKPLPQATISKIAQRYKDRLLAYRAEVVARTESLNALRAGRHEGIMQAVESGSIRPDQVKVRWSATLDANTRDTHKHMDDKTVALGTPFTFPDGSQAWFPGDSSLGASASEVIQCRCYAEYKVDWLNG